MSKFRFKFNKKSIILDIDETKSYKQHKANWFSTALFVHDAIMNSNIFSEHDKERISTLTIYSIYKHLKKV